MMISAVIEKTAKRYTPTALTVVSLVASVLMYTVVSAAATVQDEHTRTYYDDHNYRGHDEHGKRHHARGKWLSGDFHQHSFYTDGSTPIDFEMSKNNEYGLDWWANSEHGGGFPTDGNGHKWVDPLYHPVNPILGDKSGNPQVMWRWQTLRDFAYPDVVRNRSLYPTKRIFSGLEWNVPGHEHCSTSIVGKDPSAISAFEFMFDGSDNDSSRIGEATPYGILEKKNGKTYTVTTDASGNRTVSSASKAYPDRHLDSVAACAWMEQQYQNRTIDNGWIVFAHVERKGPWSPIKGGGYNIEHYRDYNSAGPDVCFGFEGAPGHQVNHWRGFGNAIDPSTGQSIDFGGTYGGVGFYTAKVGGLWDALLGEGRRWFNFASSDYHGHYTAGGDDFYPGEYQRNWVYAVDKDGHGKYSLDEIADGLRSGNAFFVMGDLINYLDFTVRHKDDEAAMGGTLKVHDHHRKNPVKIVIKFKSPDINNCKVDGVGILSCAAPVVDHIDLIAGAITGKIAPTDPNYTKATNETTKVIATFTKKDLKTDREGYHTIVYTVKDLEQSTYFRLRGTNLAPNTPFETDADGNPLPDYLVTQYQGIDGAQEAWNDLWFYSNPIFVYVK